MKQRGARLGPNWIALCITPSPTNPINSHRTADTHRRTVTFEIHRLEGHAMKEVQPRLMTTRDTAIYLSVSEAAL
ncbi:hypothetical protein GCM10022376_19940 [Yimella lutea]